MGITLREIIFDIGGGIPDGKEFKAVQIGGPSGGCIPAEHLDIQVDYESLKRVGAIMGSGGLVVMDEDTCMVDVARFFMEFIQREAAASASPAARARGGCSRSWIHRIPDAKMADEEENLLRFNSVLHLESLAQVIKDTCLCGLGQTAPNPVLSTLRWFRDEYEAHIYDRQCPAHQCKRTAHLHDRRRRMHGLHAVREEMPRRRRSWGTMKKRALHRGRQVHRAAAPAWTCARFDAVSVS